MADRLEIAFVVSGLTGVSAALAQTASAAGGVTSPGHLASVSAAMGQFLDVVGMAGPEAKVAAERLKVLKDAIMALATVTTQAVTEFQNAQVAMNASARETLTLGALGHAFGVNAAASAAALRQQANFSPLGRVAAGSLGIPFAPYDLSNAQNTGRDLLNAIEAARKLFREDPQKMALVFRNLPELQNWAAVIEAQKDLVPLIEQQAKAWERVFTPANIEAVTEFKVQLSILEAKLMELAVTIGGPLLTALNAVLDDINKGQIAHPSSSAAFGLGRGPGTSEAHAAQTAHTAAVRENTEAIRSFAGTFGGGRRAQSAIPGAFGGNLSRDGGWAQLKGHASRLGAYSIGL